MPIYTTPNGDRYEFNGRSDSIAQAFERDYPNATVEMINGNTHYEIPLSLIDQFLKDFPDGDYWSSTRAQQQEPKESPAQEEKKPGFSQRLFSADNLQAAGNAFGSHGAMNAQTPYQESEREASTPDTNLQARQQQLNAARQQAGQQDTKVPNFSDQTSSIFDNPEQQRFDYRYGENGFVNPAAQRKGMPNIQDIDRIAEEEKNIDFKAKPVKNAQDLMDNVVGRFSLTEEGQALQAEADEAMRQHIIQLTDEFTRSPEYKELAKQKPESQEELDELNKKLNETFQDKYGEELASFMEPYYKRIQDAATERYKGTVEEESRRLNVENSTKVLSALTDEIKDLREKHGQTASANLRAARKLVEQSNNLLNAVDKGSWEQAALGFWDNLDDRTLPFIGGFLDWADNETLRIAIDKFEKGETLNKEEEALLTASAINMTLNAYYDGKLRGYNIGSGIADSLPYMMEIMASPIAQSGNAVAKSLIKYGMKMFGRKAVDKAVPKFLSRLAGEAVAGARMTATTGAPRVMADYANTLNSNYTLSLNDNGGLQMEKTGYTTGMEAFSKAVRTNFYEYFSESAFNSLAGAGKYLPKNIEKAAKYLENTGIGQMYKMTLGSKLAKSAEWHGVLAEYGEEVMDNVLEAASGDMKWEDVADLDKNVDTFLSVAPISLLFGAAGAASYVKEKRQNERRMEELFGKMNEEQQKELAELQEMAKNGKVSLNREVKRFLRATFNSDNLTQEERRAEIEYLFDMVKQQAINEIDAQRTPEQRKGDEVEMARMDGYDAPDEQKNNVKVQYEAALADLQDDYTKEMIDVMDTDPAKAIQAYKDDPKVLDYIKAKAAYDGMNSLVQDDINAMVAESDARVDSNRHNLRGDVEPATLKNGREVYVISGDAVMKQDGSGIDTDRSSRELIIKDKETGTLKFVPASDIAGVDKPINADELKTQSADAIRQDMARKQADLIDGKVAVGESYPAIGIDGTEVEVTIISDNGDGSVNVGINGEASGIPMPMDAVQQMVDRYRLQQAQAANMERRAEQAMQDGNGLGDAALANNGLNGLGNAALANGWAYYLNEQVPVTLPDGTAGTAFVQAEPNADGNYEVELADEAGNSLGVRLMSQQELNAMEVVPQTETAAPAEVAAAQPEAEQQPARSGETESPKQDEAQPEPMPMIGEGEDAMPDYGKVNPERAHQYLYKESGLDEADADEFVKAYRKDAEAELKKVKNKPPKPTDKGINGNINKFKVAKEAWQQQVDDAQRQVDYWNAVEQEQAMVVRQREQEAQEAAERERLMNMTDAERAMQNDLSRMEPRNLEELAAQMIGTGSVKLIRGTYGQQTGYGNDEAKKLFRIFAGADKGGVSIDKAGEMLEEAARGLNIRFDESDANAGRNAIIGVLQEVRTWGDLMNYIKNARDAEQARLAAEQERYEAQQRDEWAQENFKMDYEDYMAWENDYLPTVAEEYSSTPDEGYEEISNDLNNRDNERVTTETGSGAERSGEVLPGSQSADEGRTGETGEQGDGEGNDTALRGEDENVPAAASRGGEVEEGSSSVNEQANIYKKIEEARQEVDTNPTDAQKDAGNYKKGHIKLDGYDITLENPKGSTRSGKDASGKEWSVTMHNDYGYIRMTEGVDGDHIDVFLSDNPTEGNVYVIDQVDPKTGKFDEHKVMYGFANEEEARQAYLSNYSEGWQGLGNITGVTKEEFKKWVESSHRKTKPFAEYKSVARAKEIEQQEAGGAMVDQLENMGLDVSTDLEENRKALKEAKEDKSDAGKVRYFKTSDGKTYGFSYKGKIYLDLAKINAELPIHEYAHLWCEALRRLNPKNWKKIVELTKADKETWDFVRQLDPELKDENDIAEEMIARFSGKRGAELAMAEFERMNGRDPNYKSKWANIWKNISKVIQDFWKQVGDFLNMEYESVEQLYDQVVKDFADKMNPRKRVEDWLKSRDDEYLQAVADNDMDKAKQLFDEALRENIGNGITPYIAVDSYRNKLDGLARGVKNRDPEMIAKAAELMAPLIPKDAVLVPAPSHNGEATDMLDLANAIGKLAGVPVANVLKGKSRVSQYKAKKSGQVIAAKDMGIRMDGELPEGRLPVIIDNVVDSGNTAEACVQAIGKGVVASLANAADKQRHVASLKSAEPVVTDRNGNVVPLSQRFEMGGSKYLGKPRMQKAQASTKPSKRETALRDALTDLMKQAGVEVSTDTEEGQRVLDADRERRAMASLDKSENISEIGSRNVRNVVIDSVKEKLPESREEAIESIPKGGLLCENDDQKIKMLVSRQTVRHSTLHDEAYVAKTFGDIKEVVKNAVKIGNLPVADNEKGKTASVGIYYVPINVDGVQYSGRLVVKELINKKGFVLDDLLLYDLNMHKEKTPLNTNVGTSKDELVYSSGVPFDYKVSDLIYSTQENDIKLSGLEKKDKDKFRFSKELKPPFYSNAMKAVQGIKQEKATPEQWLAMIEKAGGLKAGEDKWTGLADWLKGQDKKTLTKQEVMDYIQENQIQVEDVEYTEGVDDTSGSELDQLRDKFNRLVEKYENERVVMQDEGTALNQEMYDKYGYGWYEKLDEADRKRYDDLEERYKRLSGNDSLELAFQDMVDEYGDDFGMAFEVNYGSGKLDPQMDMYSDNLSDAAKYFLDVNPINSTRLDYTTDGLENKREIALVVPSVESWNEGDKLHFGDAGGGRAVAWVRFGETIDKDGNRVLVVDEIQSKRHQEGREKGYKSNYNESELKEAQDASWKYGNLLYEKYIKDKHPGGDFLKYATAEERRHFDELSDKVASLKQMKYGAIPDAPFEKNWHVLAMKRILRYAAENGYDKVAWTKGDQQAERYDLSHKIEDFYYKKNEDGTYNISAIAKVQRDGYVDYPEYKFDNQTEKQLAELLGKDVAEKVVEGKGRKGYTHNGTNGWTTFKGNDLKMGGEGMKGFYDQMLPRFMDKYGKKWGVKTGEVELPKLGDNGLTMWSIDVTPEMKESVMEGQPMFFRTPDGQAYGYTLNGKVYIDPRIATAETPLHEFAHLWAEALRKGNAKEWQNVVDLMKGTPIWEEVKKNYPELTNDDDIAEEVLAHYSGRRGAERLRQAQAEAMEKAGSDVFAQAEAISAFDSVNRAIKRFWKAFADFLHIHYESAEEVADRVMADLLDGVNPNRELEKLQGDPHKAAQLDIVTGSNAMTDDYHVGIRSVDDIKTYQEAVEEGEGIDSYPDFTAEDAQRALDEGEVTVYSSKPIENGVFVSTSRMEAQDYAGDGKVYSKRVPLADVAWIYANEGQYAKVDGKVRPQKVNEAAVSIDDLSDMSDEQLLNNIDLGGPSEEDAFAIEYDERHRKEFDAYYDQTAESLQYERPSLEDASARLNDLIRQWKRGAYASSMRTPIKAQMYAFDDYVANLTEQEVDSRTPEEFTPGVQPKQEGSETTTYVTTKGKKAEYRQLSLDFDTPVEANAKPEQKQQTKQKPKQEEKPVGVDLTQVRLRELGEGEVCYVERRFTEDKSFVLTGGKNKIKTADDVAYIFRCLEDKAIEHAFMVFVKKGEPTIVHVGMGMVDQTAVDPSVLSTLAEELQPDKIYFVHNHPSGRLIPSQADKSLVRSLRDRVNPDIPITNMIIDTYLHQYNLFEATGSSVGEGEVRVGNGNNRRLPLFAFDERLFHEDFLPKFIEDSRDVFITASLLRLGDNKKIGCLVMDKAGIVMGNLYLPVSNIRDISEDMARNLIKEITLMNGTQVALHGTTKFITQELNDLIRKFKHLAPDVRVTDVIQMDGENGDFPKYYSAVDQGAMEPASVYGVKEPGGDITYNVVRDSGHEPTKTGKGYKVFVLKDGKLYPPMVANPNGAATPVGVWLEAQAAPISGESKTGRPQVKAGGKGTQGGSGTLAYRPGWHLGEIPYAKQFNRKDEAGEKNLFPKNFVWAEVEYANNVDYQDEARKEGTNANGKYQHSLAGLKRVPVNGSYRYRTNPDPTTDEWIITGAMKVNRILTPSEVDEMVRAAGREPQQRQDGAVTDEQVRELNENLFGNQPLTKRDDEDLFAFAERVAAADALRRAREAERKAAANRPLTNDEAAAAASDFQQEHKGAIENIVYNGKGNFKQQLAEAGITGKDAGVYEQRLKGGRISAFYSPKYNRNIFLAPNVARKELNSYLWHENFHHAFDALYGESKAALIDAAYEKLVSIGGWTDGIIDMVRKRYADRGEAVVKEEVMTYFIQMLCDGTKNGTDAELGKALDTFINDKAEDGSMDFLKETLIYIIYGKDYDGRRMEERGREDAQAAQGNESGVLRHPGRVRTAKGTEEDKFVISPASGGSVSTSSTSAPIFQNPNITMRDKATARDEYEKMISSGLYQFREAVQDSMRGLYALYKSVLGKEFTKIEDVPGFENAYLGENRMSSQSAAEQHDYFNRFMTPLLETIGKLTGGDKAKRDELTRYMMAKHGLERNVVLAERDARIAEEGGGDYADALAKNRERDYSGLTALTKESDVTAAEAKAMQIVDDYENNHDKALLDELWDRTREASHATLEKLYRSGLMSYDTYQKTLAMFQNYIPLRGWDETTSDEVYGYLTANDSPLLGSVLKKAAGRTSVADDPIAYIAQMADKAIMEGNRNRMKQTFLNFVLNHPSDLVSVSDLWLQHDDVNDTWVAVFPELEPTDTAEEVAQKLADFENRMTQLATADPEHFARGREKPNIPYKVVKGNMREHQVLVKRNGKVVVLTINGNPRAAQALNGLTNPDVNVNGVVGNLLRAGEYVNRNLSAFYTTRNPDFVVSNFLRDMVYSNVMTWVKENPRYAMRFHRNVGKLNPVTMRKLLGKWENGTLDDDNYTENMFRQFMMNGGETGYTSVRDLEAHKRNIADELKMQGSTGRKAWKALGMQLDLMNRAVENCARFAAFVTSREMGRSIERSIYDAKEISVNFNKKGSGGKMVNTVGMTWLGKAGSYLSGLGRVMYVFWNAGVQGMTNFGRAGKRNTAKAIAGGAAMYLLGQVMPLLALLLSDGDDDDKDAYYNLPEYIRRNSICFFAGDQWVTIPLPIELRGIYGMGELATGVITGNERYSDQELAFQIASQLSQVLPLDMLEGGGGITPFIPSSVKPLVEAYVLNRRWTGLPVYKDTPYNKNDPEWTKAYKSADQTLVEISKFINEATGGDDFKKGAIDINPAKVEYLLSGVLGGYENTVEKLKKMAETAAGQRDFEWRNMLLANRVVTSGDESTEFRKLQNEFYRYKDEADETKRLLRKYENAENEGVLGMAEKVDFLMNSDEYRRYEIYEEYKDDIDAYREMIQDSNDRDEKKELEREMYGVIKEMLARMKEK